MIASSTKILADSHADFLRKHWGAKRKRVCYNDSSIHSVCAAESNSFRRLMRHFRRLTWKLTLATPVSHSSVGSAEYTQGLLLELSLMHSTRLMVFLRRSVVFRQPTRGSQLLLRGSQPMISAG